MNIGYSRTSTKGTHLLEQHDALYHAGCKKIFEESCNENKKERPILLKAIHSAHHGDTFIVWKLDRISRSFRKLLDIVHSLEKKGIYFKSLKESINTYTHSGKFIFHIFAALCEFESNVIRERTITALHAARNRGIKGGRPRVLDKNQQRFAVQLYKERKYTIAKMCEIIGVSKPTFYKYIYTYENNK